MVESVAVVNGLEMVQLAAEKDGGGVAVFFDVADAVRDNEHGAVATLFEKLVLAARPEAVVAHGHDFIDEVTVELDDHGQREGQSCPHAGGIGLHRPVEIGAEFREFLDSFDCFLAFGAGDALNGRELAGIVAAGL